MPLTPVSPIRNKGLFSDWLSAAPGGASALTIGTNGNVSTTPLSSLGPTTNASDLVTGTLNDARLSANVPKYDIQGPTYEANRPFGFIRDSFNLTANATPYQNTVEQWGYNLRRSNTNEPAGGFAIESKYALNNQGPYVMEFHIQGQYTNGNVWRLFSAAHPIAEADLATSQCGFITQTFSLQKADGSQRIKYDWTANSVTYTSAQTHVLESNNYAAWQQRNAANTAYIQLPYIDSSDRTRIPTAVAHFDGKATFAFGEIKPLATDGAFMELKSAAGLAINLNNQETCTMWRTSSGSGYMTAFRTFDTGTPAVRIQPTHADYIGHPFEILRPNGSRVFGGLLYNEGGANANAYFAVSIGNSNVIGNLSLEKGGALELKDASASRWYIYTANSSWLYLRDLTNGRMHFELVPGNSNTVAETRINSSVQIAGNSGFNGTAPIAKPTVTGSRGGNAALASLLTALANYGLITDSTS